MKNTQHSITFTDKELRLVLNALGQRPFSEVYELIEKIVTTTSNPKETSVNIKTNRIKK